MYRKVAGVVDLMVLAGAREGSAARSGRPRQHGAGGWYMRCDPGRLGLQFTAAGHQHRWWGRGSSTAGQGSQRCARQAAGTWCTLLGFHLAASKLAAVCCAPASHCCRLWAAHTRHTTSTHMGSHAMCALGRVCWETSPALTSCLCRSPRRSGHWNA